MKSKSITGSKFNILHILNHSLPYIQDGYTLRSESIIKEQMKLRYNVIAATRPDFPGEKIANANKIKNREFYNDILYYRENMQNLQYKLLRKIALIINNSWLDSFNGKNLYKKYLLNIVKKHNINILHIANPAANIFPAKEVSLKMHIPIIYEVRGIWEDTACALGKITEDSDEYNRRKQNETSAMLLADAVITLSDSLKNMFINRSIPEEKIFVVPNGVDTEKYIPNDPDKKLSEILGVKDSIVIGYIGSVRRIEGLEFVIKAMPSVLDFKKNIKLIIIGEGSEKYRLRQLTYDMGLQKNIIFVDKVQNEMIAKYYSLIDIFVLYRISALSCQLVPPLKILEAMAMEKPVIISDVNALKEVINDGETGLITNCKDINDLTKKILCLVSNSELRKKIGKNARKWVKENRTWSKIVTNYNPIYQQLVKEKANL